MQKYQRIYRAVYDFHARHPVPVTSDEWAETFTDMRDLQERIGVSLFLSDMLAAIIREIKRAGEAENEQSKECNTLSEENRT